MVTFVSETGSFLLTPVFSKRRSEAASYLVRSGRKVRRRHATLILAGVAVCKIIARQTVSLAMILGLGRL